MTDTTAKTTPPPKKNNNRFVVGAFIAILLIAVLGYIVSTKSGLDRAMVETAIQEWSANISEQTSGATTFEYEDIVIEGGPTNRHAIVVNPKIITRQQESQQWNETTIATPKATLYPTSIAMDGMKLLLADPITMSQDGKEKARLESEEPFEITVEQITEDDEKQIDHRMVFPPKVIITNLDAESGTPEEGNLTVTTDGNALFESRTDADYKRYSDTRFTVKGVHITDSTKTAPLLVKAFDLKVKWEQDEPVADEKAEKDAAEPAAPLKGKMDVKWEIAEIFSTKELMPYGPISVDLDLAYDGPLPEKDAKPIDWSTQKSNIKLNTLSIKSDDIQTAAKLDFETGSGDLLPIGSGLIEVKNFAFVRDEMKKAGLIDEGNAKLLDTLLRGITDTGFEELEDLAIPFSREAGGSFKIGNSTFEELFALVLTQGALGGAVPPADGALPDAAVPAAKEPVIEPTPPAAE